MAENAQVLIAQAKTYFKDASDLTIRKRLWLKMMEEFGLFVYNASGYDANWDVMFSQPDLEQYGDGDENTFANHNAYKQATIDIRGYKMTDMLTEKQRLMNRGEGQIINLISKKSENMVKSFRDKFGGELYIDGNATGNSNRFHGIESFFGAGSCASTDRVAKCNDTYANISTVQANYGGNWSTVLASADRPNATLATDWPDGKGDPEYDFWSPIIANYSASTWPSTEITWEANCVDVLRAVTGWLRKNTGDDDVPTLHMLDSKMMREFKQSQDPSLRTIVPHKMSQDLGFEDVLKFEGAAIKQEFDATAGVGYSLTPSAMEGFFLTPKLFDTGDSPHFDFKSQSTLFFLKTWGNFRFQPKFFAKLAAVA